jgi:flagella basal body P-ring formation protein FlgA
MKWTLIVAMFACRAFACQTVDGPAILGRDLAAANSYFAPLDPRLAIGASPMPGVQRVFHGDELVRLARQNSLPSPTPLAEICFERATELLTAEKLLPVLKTALGIENAEISILDFSRYGVPAGALQFNAAGLTPAGIWRGRVSYDDNRSVSIWVKVQITSEQTWVEAVESLVSAKPIAATQLIVRKGPRFPIGAVPVGSIEAAEGRLPIRAIKPGEPIFASMLLAPHEVERGDKVTVEVISGEARLIFDASAETAGRLGEFILIRNPENGKSFQARIEGKDKVVIQK